MYIRTSRPSTNSLRVPPIKQPFINNQFCIQEISWTIYCWNLIGLKITLRDGTSATVGRHHENTKVFPDRKITSISVSRSPNNHFIRHILFCTDYNVPIFEIGTLDQGKPVAPCVFEILQNENFIGCELDYYTAIDDSQTLTGITWMKFNAE